MGIIEFLSYGFIQRALIAGIFISLLCSILGTSLVLRRFSLIGDGLAHVAFGGMAIGLVLKVYPLYISIPVVMASSLLILKLTERGKLYGDAAIGIVSSMGIAIGVLLVSIAGGLNIDLFSYLFGNILAISEMELAISIALSIVVLLGIYSYHSEIFSVAFDEEFAHVSGINTKRLNSIFIMLTAITVVLAIKVVGIMLTSALLILPAVTSFQIARGFKSFMIIASFIGVVSVIAGIFISYFLNLPTGALIVIVNFFFFTAALLIKTKSR